MSTKQKFVYLPKVHHKIMMFLVVLYFFWEGFAGVFNSINLTRFFMENPTGDYATTTIVINAIGIPMGGVNVCLWLHYYLVNILGLSTRLRRSRHLLAQFLWER